MSSKKTVYNRNFLKPTPDNMELVVGHPVLDTDYKFNLQGSEISSASPQITFHAHLVPPLEDVDVEPPFILLTVPAVETFIGQTFSGSFVVEYNEAVSNATELSNYIFRGQAQGSLFASSVVELAPSSSGGTRVEITTSGAPKPDGILELHVGESSVSPITDSSGNVMAVEVLDWYLDYSSPRVTSVAPDGTAPLDPTTYDWTIDIDFTEYVLDTAGGWKDLSHYDLTLVSGSSDFSNYTLTPIVVTESSSSRVYSYGDDAGQLSIKVYFQDPTSELSASLSAYTAAVLLFRDVDTIVDRANNSLLQPEKVVIPLVSSGSA